MRKIFSSLRFRLMAIVLLASLPALALMLITGLEQRATAAHEAQDSALRLAEFAAANNEILIEDTRVLLIAMTHSFNLLLGDADNCSHFFEHLTKTHFPFYSAFYLADLHGNVLCSIPGGDLPLDLLGCDHYQTLVQADDFVVSEYHLCRNSGAGVISMGYPLLDMQHTKVGVVNVGIDLKWFGEFAARANLPENSTLTVFDHSGTTLAHYPDPQNWVGKTLPEELLRDTILAQLTGTSISTGHDGIERLYAYLPLTGSQDQVFVNVGIPLAVAYADANASLLRNMSALLLVSGLSLFAAWLLGHFFVMRETNTLVETTRRLAAGDLTARTNRTSNQGELGLLASSIDSMADALTGRERERDEAEQEIRAYAAELERSNRDLLEFANITSHDLQEPLRKIQTFNDLLQTRYAGQLDAQGNDYLQRMHAAAQHMQELVISLLSYSRISTRSQPATALNLGDIIARVIQDLDFQIEECQASVTIGQLPTLQADPLQMEQLFANLIGNALKFRQEGRPPVIEIHAQRVPETSLPQRNIRAGRELCEIQVKDNGIGFDEKYLDRIFQPFQRLNNHAQFPGTGMGLAICRKIVERHGGSLTATSQPGAGATFIIRLPFESPTGGSR